MPKLYVTYTDPDTDERRVAEVETTLALPVYRAEAFVYGVLLDGRRAVAPWLVRGVSTEAPKPKPGDGFRVTLENVTAGDVDPQAVAEAIRNTPTKRGRR